MKNKKADGTDKIANEIIKHFQEKIVDVILQPFNTFLESRKIPVEWCEGLVAPIYKENEKITLITIGVSAFQTHS